MVFAGLGNPVYGSHQWYGSEHDLMSAVRRTERKMKPWIKVQCRRFEIPGRVTKDDLYQEALLYLMDAVQCWDLRPEGEKQGQFEALLRTVIAHRLCDRFRRENYRVKKSVLFSSFDENFEDGEANPLFQWNRTTKQRRHSDDPLHGVLIEELISSIRVKLDEDEQALLTEYITPGRKFRGLVATAMAAGHRVRLSRPSNELFGTALGWDKKRSHETWNRLRHKIADALGCPEAVVIGTVRTRTQAVHLLRKGKIKRLPRWF
jgi:DNA-directed RNA polymerase specialized sigma24 family protein